MTRKRRRKENIFSRAIQLAAPGSASGAAKGGLLKGIHERGTAGGSRKKQTRTARKTALAGFSACWLTRHLFAGIGGNS